MNKKVALIMGGIMAVVLGLVLMFIKNSGVAGNLAFWAGLVTTMIGIRMKDMRP